MPPPSPESLPLGAGAELEQLTHVVRRVVRARVRDPHLVDDIVQETLTRVLSRGDDLGAAARQPYAIVTATNLVASTMRTEGRRTRLLHRLVDPRASELPEEEVLRVDERRSMSDAMTRLSDRDRDVLISHEVLDLTTKELADGAGTSAGAIAVRLAAARAKLRLEYVLSHRREAPLPPRCRSVLLAISAGDRRRQLATDAEAHMRCCDRCSELSQPLLARSRASAALLPLLGLRSATERVRAAVRDHRATAATGPAAAVVAAILVAQASLGSVDAPDQTRSAPVTSDRPTRPVPATTGPGPVHVDGVALRQVPHDALAGRTVVASAALVHAVPADEGFWMEDGGGGRIWVQLVTDAESPMGIRRGGRATFVGTLVVTPPGYAPTVGVDEAEGAGELVAGGLHIEVEAAAVRLG